MLVMTHLTPYEEDIVRHGKCAANDACPDQGLKGEAASVEIFAGIFLLSAT